MRIAASLMALLALGTAMPAQAQGVGQIPGSGPKLGQLEIKAYQAIPKTKVAVQLTSDSALNRNLRREVMVRLARRGNEVGFSGGNVMRMDVQYTDLLGGSGVTRGPVGGYTDKDYDGPAANPRPPVPGVTIDRSPPNGGGPTLRITLTLYTVDGGKVLWTATGSCKALADNAQRAGEAMINRIFDAADNNTVGDAGCPL